MFSIIEQKFGIRPEQFFKLTGYDAFMANQLLYIMISVHENEQKELPERYYLTNFLRENGEKYVPVFVPALDGTFVHQKEGGYFVLLMLDRWENAPVSDSGYELANFHKKGFGMQIEIKNLNRTGQWKTFWEKRLDQLEDVWKKTVMAGPGNDFETYFAESFPYYLAMAENAIQYFVDTIIDETPGPFDVGTVTHERFSPQTWSGMPVWKNPFQWIVDHPSRDLAEWIRFVYFHYPQTYPAYVQRFFSAYEKVMPVSSFGKRLLYSRLLFPVHYFRCIEYYYIRLQVNANVKQDITELKKIIKTSEQYENFLAEILKITGFPGMPVPDWLR